MPVPEGVASKDLDKIQKLREFMAKQQNSTQGGEKSSPGKNYRSSNGGGRGANGAHGRGRGVHSGNFSNNSAVGRGHNSSSGRGRGRGHAGRGLSAGSSSDTRSKEYYSTRGQSVNENDKLEGKFDEEKDREGKMRSDSESSNVSGRNHSGLSPNSMLPPFMSQNGAENMAMIQQMQAMFGTQGLPFPPPFPNFPNSNRQGILGDPLGNKKKIDSKAAHEANDAHSSVKPKNRNFNGPPLSPRDSSSGSSTSSQPKGDNSERSKSLDFIKDFFKNDPEVQQQRATKSSATGPSAPPVMGVYMAKQMKKNPGAVMQAKSLNKQYLEASKTFPSEAKSNTSMDQDINLPSPRDMSLDQVSGNFMGNMFNPLNVPPELLNSISPDFLNKMAALQFGQFHQGMNQHSNSHSNALFVPPNTNNFRYGNDMNSKQWQQTTLDKCGPIDSAQARSLIEQLVKGTYECMVCCDSIKLQNSVWSCNKCYHIFHLSCIKRWARSESAAVKDESGWRCPGCQHVSTRPPNKYFCFCGKVRDPDWNPLDGITPHSCGEMCMKKRTSPPCEHGCNELCHPGPCPSCPVMITKHCPCGKKITKVRCGQGTIIKCESQCRKLLKCGKHYCQLKCHEGDCSTCEIKVVEGCYCSKEQRITTCGTGETIPYDNAIADNIPKLSKRYSCMEICGKLLKCGHHNCEATCHPGECNECPLMPHKVQFCPCGKVPVTSLTPNGTPRQDCTDAIPTCDSFCGKKLSCGPKGSAHLCMTKCHIGKCQPCKKTTSVQCRCGSTKKDIACTELNPNEPVLCEKKCNKKRRCGRHKCNQKCCTDHEHACNIICGKKLPCGMHKCDEVCHAGFCPPCWRAGFEELSCNCGETVLYPPIACGTKPPECDKPCQRSHACSHAPTHPCHSEETCPPCTVLENKQCMGAHEIWKNVPCHLKEVSCGRPCGKLLRCNLHKCNKACHKAPCLELEELCTLPCPYQRRDCQHPCNAPCHVGVECPSTPCKAQITINCRCGRKSANAMCLAGNINTAYHRFTAEMLSGQLKNLQSGQSIDLSGMSNIVKQPKFIDCDQECARIERNKRLAEALGVENHDGSHFNHIIFSQFLKDEAKIQLPFIQMLEQHLENLVMVAKKSSQPQIHHAFPSMNMTQRKIIHELAEAYGCKTFSMDKEPNRNTVAVATKDSFLPNVKLSVMTERELVKPPPQPMMVMSDNRGLMMGSASLPLQTKSVMDPSGITQGMSSSQSTPQSLMTQQGLPQPMIPYSNQQLHQTKPNYFDEDFVE